MRTRTLGTGTALAAALLFSNLLFSNRAAAGPVEQLDTVNIAPTDPKTLLLSYRNGGGGIFVSHDAGKTFTMLCNSAIDPSIQRPASALILRNDKTILAGVFNGMWRADENACGFVSDAAFDGQWVNAFAIDPLDPKKTYLVTSAGGKLNGAFVNQVGSNTWTKLGKQEDLLISTLNVVATGKSSVRIYESAVRGTYNEPSPDGGMGQDFPNYVIRFTDDLGKTWTEYPFGKTDGEVRMQAVDPTDPNRIVVGVLRDEVLSDGTTAPDDLVYSASAGKPGSFKTIGQVTELGGLSFAPDGRMFYGDREQTTPALRVVSKLGAAPKLLTNAYKVQCVNYDAQTDTLYVCQDRLFGTADPATGAFSLLFDDTKEDKLVSCTGSDTSAACESQFLMGWCGTTHYPTTPICEPYGVPGVVFPAADGGTGTGKPVADGGPRDAGVAKAKSSGCACALPGERAGSTGGLLALLGLGALVVQRRTRRTRRAD